MRTIILASLLLFSAASHAQVQMSKTVLCGSPQQVLEAFQGPKFKEVVRWTGTDIQREENTYILLSNLKTGTFTFIEMNEKFACILGTGTKSTFFTGSAAPDSGEKL